MRIAWKLWSPTLSRLGVSRDPEIENKATKTGLRLGLVAEMNLVELGLVAAMNMVELGLVVVYGDGISGLGLVLDRRMYMWTQIGGGQADVYGSGKEYVGAAAA